MVALNIATTKVQKHKDPPLVLQPYVPLFTFIFCCVPGSDSPERNSALYPSIASNGGHAAGCTTHQHPSPYPGQRAAAAAAPGSQYQQQTHPTPQQLPAQYAATSVSTHYLTMLIPVSITAPTLGRGDPAGTTGDQLVTNW